MVNLLQLQCLTAADCICGVGLYYLLNGGVHGYLPVTVVYVVPGFLDLSVIFLAR